jgi:hypothetical protein
MKEDTMDARQNSVVSAMLAFCGPALVLMAFLVYDESLRSGPLPHVMPDNIWFYIAVALIGCVGTVLGFLGLARERRKRRAKEMDGRKHQFEQWETWANDIEPDMTDWEHECAAWQALHEDKNEAHGDASNEDND